jgi:hypothetical protein
VARFPAGVSVPRLAVPFLLDFKEPFSGKGLILGRLASSSLLPLLRFFSQAFFAGFLPLFCLPSSKAATAFFAFLYPVFILFLAPAPFPPPQGVGFYRTSCWLS